MNPLGWRDRAEHSLGAEHHLHSASPLLLFQFNPCPDSAERCSCPVWEQREEIQYLLPRPPYLFSTKDTLSLQEGTNWTQRCDRGKIVVESFSPFFSLGKRRKSVTISFPYPRVFQLVQGSFVELPVKCPHDPSSPKPLWLPYTAEEFPQSMENQTCKSWAVTRIVQGSQRLL